MKQQRFKLYKLDIKYIRKLARYDKNILSVSPQINKENRPFLGIILILGVHKYCIPLSSPKPKHHNMKNRADFTKIYDDNKLIGVLNFNNMIPVSDSVISEINLKISPADNPQTKQIFYINPFLPILPLRQDAATSRFWNKSPKTMKTNDCINL